jgi:hypothetical protein
VHLAVYRKVEDGFERPFEEFQGIVLLFETSVTEGFWGLEGIIE